MSNPPVDSCCEGPGWIIITTWRLKGTFVDSFTLKKVEFDAVRQILSRFAGCPLGRQLAAKIAPSRTPGVIQRWLNETTQMIRAIRDVGTPPLGSVTDITELLARAKPGGGATGEEFITIAATLEGAAGVRNYLNPLPEDLHLLHALAAVIGNFEGEIKAIRTMLEPDGRVRDGASERLGTLRREMERMARQIHELIYSYLRDPQVAKLLTNPTVTLHGDRYVLPVRSDNRGRLPGVVHRASHTGMTVFVEPNACVELNNRLADLREDERQEVRRLLNELAIRISKRGEEITATLHTLGQVDLLSAKAQYAYQFDMTCPEISEHGALQFNQARHPLLIEQTHQQADAGTPPDKQHAVVPIDVRLGSDFDVLVITGSNTGGKTVTLKTVALLSIMAQSGMHIPVQRGGTMPIFRDVYLDVGDEQSLEQSLSTFGAHIKRIKFVLSKADKNSLVLLDELGAGTDPDEGGAIGQAILDELLRIGCLGMATTHLSVLKAYAFNHERVDNASVEFDTATLSPTYHLQIGTPGESHAIAVAKRLGLTKRAISAARRHLSDQGKQFRRAIQATSLARQSAEQARTEARTAQLAAENQLETYESKLADVHRVREDFELWLARLGEMKAGEEIFVPSLNKKGKLLRLELHKQIAVVDANNVQVEVPLKELMPDLGQAAIREQIDALRKQILDQAKRSQQSSAEAERMRDEYHRSLKHQKERARQFDNWLGAIGRVKVGDEVSIARKPGTAKVVKVDLPGLRVKVRTRQGEMDLPLQDLFPQTGPFAAREPTGRHRGRTRTRRPAGPPEPIRRRRPDEATAKANRQKILDTPLPLADLEPVREKRP